MKLAEFGSFLRAPNGLTAAADVLAGAAIAGAALDARLALAAAGAVALYCGGIVLNDAMDAAKDAQTHAERAIPSGKISALAAVFVAAGLLFLGALPALLQPERIPLVAALIGCIVLYDIIPERWSWGALFFMGACRALNLACGVALGVEHWSVLASVAVAAQFSLIAALTWVSQQEGKLACAPRVVRTTLLLLIPWSACWGFAGTNEWFPLIILALWPLQLGLRRLLQFKTS